MGFMNTPTVVGYMPVAGTGATLDADQANKNTNTADSLTLITGALYLFTVVDGVLSLGIADSTVEANKIRVITAGHEAVVPLPSGTVFHYSAAANDTTVYISQVVRV